MRDLPRSLRTALAVLALLLVSALGACSTTVAQPAATPSSSVVSPEPAEPTGTLLSSVDERLDNLITEIEQNRDDVAVPGYAGVSVDAEHRALDLWWVGEPPERIRRLITAPPDGLIVRLHPRRTTSPRCPRRRRADKSVPSHHAVSPESDGSGIEVETTAKGGRSLPGAAGLAEEVGMPVRVVINEPPVAA